MLGRAYKDSMAIDCDRFSKLVEVHAIAGDELGLLTPNPIVVGKDICRAGLRRGAWGAVRAYGHQISINPDGESEIGERCRICRSQGGLLNPGPLDTLEDIYGAAPEGQGGIG